ncbi:hypothetical protein SLE2022_112900 [Rubroshorea leprosula]
MESPRRIEGRSILRASELTRDRSDEFAEQETTLSEDSPMTQWTDEKHSLYLDSMEASFVNQLYRSMNFLGFNLHNKKSSGTRSSSSSSRQTHGDHAHTTPSDQFEVLQGGCLKKINFERPEFGVNGISHGLVASPWIQHFRSGSRLHHVLTSPSIHQSASMDLDGKQAILFGSASNSKHFHPCRFDHFYNHDLIGNNTEVTDQNFADDETGEKASNACSSKKKKTIETDTSSNDHTIYRTYKHPKQSLHL